MRTRGFHWFVAMRYLRGAHYSRSGKPIAPSANVPAGSFLAATLGVVMRKGSKVLLILTALCAASLATFLVWRYAFLHEPKPFHPLDPWLQRTELGAIISGALMVIVGSLAAVRAIFSFNSTVSMFGVWIGTMALVFVLSVMSGFESDLRQKILGSNAHIQISKVDGKGEFTEWEDIQAKVKKVPGVVASTAFATTEVVIAANNNYFNVVVKGIDPTSIGAVTHLIDDLECGEAKCTPAEAKEVMARLDPLIDEHDDLEVPQTPPAHKGSTTDEAPPDMVNGTDPIDYSGARGGGSGAGSADDRDGDDDRGGDGDDDAGSGSGDTGDDDTDVMPPSDFGGDARRVLGPDAAVVDPAPSDMDVPGDLEPEDFSGGDDAGDDDGSAGGGDDTATVTIEPNEFSPPSRRAKMLDGILVGRELTKQIHLYTDQEVKLVSPITNPANPDANGTPIPYNRDYRIAGTFFTGMYEYDLKFVYMTLDSLQTFLDRGDAIDGIEVRIGDPDDTSSVLAAIQRAIGPDYKVQDWQELNRSLFSALKLEKIAMFLVLAIIILVASFSIVGNLVMVVVEKGKEIALLKTLGASDRGVTWIFVTQGFFIGLIGTGIGVAYGLIGCFLAKQFGIPINPDVYYIDKLPIHVDMSSVILIAAAGVLISVGATVYPAMVASRLAPSVGLRH